MLEVELHARLSSILGTLATAAVAEITSLFKEYSVLLRLELSREKQGKETHKNNQITKKNVIESPHQIRLVCGYRPEQTRLLTIAPSARQPTESGDSLAAKEQAGWTNASSEGMDVGDKSSLTAMKTEPQPRIKQENLEDDDTELEMRMKAPEHFNISPVAQQPATGQQVFEEEWQFQCISAEGADELSDSIEHEDSDPGHIGQHHSVAHGSPEQPAGVDSENLRLQLEAELGLELHRGALTVTYPDYGALSLGNNNNETPGGGLYLAYSPENQQTTSMAVDNPASLHRRYNGSIAVSGHDGHQRGSSSGAKTSCQGTKEGRFMCKDCGKCFPYPSVLQRHILIHTGERQYLCRICGRSFIRKSHLCRHEKLHVKLGPSAPHRLQLTLPQRDTLQSHIQAQEQ